jgi:hypothetical protein
LLIHQGAVAPPDAGPARRTGPVKKAKI